MECNQKKLRVEDLELIIELADEELEAITGGINPQPLPPGISSGLWSAIFIQPQPLPPGIGSALGSTVSFL